MRKILYTFSLALALVACGTDSRHFKIDGRLLHLNQGEFYVYSPDGAFPGTDTIKVQAGRFSKDIACDRPATLMLVFPNFTEQPIFAQPGKSVDVKGDASHLKELTVKGTKDNELMNDFRQQVANASPPEAVKYARQFIADHPKSVVGTWLVRKYFIETNTPDYAEAQRLIKQMLAAQPDNAYLRRLLDMARRPTPPAAGSAMPQFAARDIDGHTITGASIAAAPVAVICVWASWNYQSIDMLRMVLQRRDESGGKIKVVGLSLDADTGAARRAMKQQGFTLPVLCDGKMIEGRLYRDLGFYNIPDNMLVCKGRVVGCGMSYDELSKQLKQQ